MIFKHKESTTLVPTSQFKLAKFPFKTFNPVQSRIVEFYDKPYNAVIAAATSAGKTIVGELYLAHEVRRLGGKGMYLSPLRALSQEKIDDWSSPDHHFADLNLAICTGDYRLTPDRKKELDEADIIVMTSEMLNSRLRNNRSENNSWLSKVSTIVCDEGHLLTVPDRGDHLENGLMKYSEINPDGRIILLSATMPNVDQISGWLTHLTGRETFLLESDYRPCKLNVHYERYMHNWNYDVQEKTKVQAAIRILQQHPADKFLFFVHTKRTGELLKKALESQDVRCEFHNADLEKSKRNSIEARFKDDHNLRAIVATSSLAWGLNLPARRVVILGVHRGLTEVENYDIQQMCGRAGRPQYDPEGDAYILLPDDKFKKYCDKLKKPEPITSQITASLPFHIISEIHHGNIRTDEDIHRWYSRTLASYQNKKLESVDDIIDSLVKCGAIINKDGNYSVTSIGTISSMFYYSPFDVSDLARNWDKLFKNRQEENDYWIAAALGAVRSQYATIVSNAERDDVNPFINLINRGNLSTAFNKNGMTDGQMKAAYCYWMMLKGTNSGNLAGFQRTLQNDSERLMEVLGVLDNMSLKSGKKDYFRTLGLRVKYGIGVELVELCQLPGIGKAKAKKLWDANLRSLKDVAGNVTKVISALNMSKNKAEELCEIAKSL